ncbi:hypothetical protein GCM10009662_69630 [Catellatospora coxensis]|uniref:Uncharacterized protein n=1 Tax=Catellatospora coxensis TaxID=310354 RepID=A0A8J3P9W6_9ACTN|nr:hypothetical protein Cco03nite_59270 [Catellatospora coxensis]
MNPAAYACLANTADMPNPVAETSTRTAPRRAERARGVLTGAGAETVVVMEQNGRSNPAIEVALVSSVVRRNFL